MFQDILNQGQFNNAEQPRFQEHLQLQDHCQKSIHSDIPSIDQEYKNIHTQSLSRQTFQETSSFILKAQKKSKDKKKRIRKYTSNNPNNKKGHWTQQENLKYHLFLEIHAFYFIDSQRRKIDKVFKSMSNFIETRQAHQCRSHHQKIQKKWGLFPNILLNLRLQNYSSMKKRYLINDLQRFGYRNHYLLEQQELENEEELYKKLIQAKLCQNGCNQEQKNEQNNQIFDNLLSHHKPNCLCLMMSEKYQDQLNI